MFFLHASLRRAHRAGRHRRFRLRAGKARRKLLLLLVLGIGVVAAGPYLIAKTPLRNLVLASALPEDAVRVTARDASLSWISGPALMGVEARDAEGNVLAVAERIALDRPLGRLLFNPRALGTIEIIAPTLHVQARADGSNVEDVMQKLSAQLAPPEPAPGDAAASKPLEFTLQVRDGAIQTTDAASGRQWRVQKLDVRCEALRDGGWGHAALSGEIVPGDAAAAAAATGRFSLAIKPEGAGRQQLSMQANGLPLAALGPWLSRLAPGSDLAGTLTCNASATWLPAASGLPSDLSTSGALSIEQLNATAPALRGDRLQLARVELPWRITAQPAGWILEDLQLRSDVARVAVRGRLDPNLSAAQHDVELRGALDVARLAAMLPNALYIRQDTTITSGTIELAGRCQPIDGGQLVTGSARTAQLAATSGGRPFRWDAPMNVSLAMRRTAGAIELETLLCDSEFLKMEAAGTAHQFTAKADFDLNRLAAQLGQFVDLSGAQLAGTGNARLAWQQTSGENFTATASGDLAQLAVSLGDGSTWAEPQLEIRGEASGAFDRQSGWPGRIDAAKLRVSGQGDELDAQLTAPVALGESPQWPIAVRASGRIARWLTRARPVFATGAWQIDGQSELAANIRLAGPVVEATNVKLTVTNFQAMAPNWSIREARVEFAGDARWDGAGQEFSAQSAQLVTSSVSVASKDVRYRSGEQAIQQLTGTAAFRADLARLASWRASADQPPEYQAQGAITGNVRFDQQGDHIAGELTANGQNLVLSSRASAAPAAGGRPPGSGGYQPIWQEPSVALRGMAKYVSSADRLTLEQIQIQSNTLQAAVTGTIEKLSTAADVNVAGTLNYDLAQMTPLLRPYLGPGVELKGREQARFAVAGKLSDEGGLSANVAAAPSDPYRLATASIGTPSVHWSRRVRAQFELPWSGANVYGLPVGAGRVAANLGEGALRIEPVSLAVGEGRLTASPHVRFDPAPAELTLPAGPLFTNVRISPEVSESMLKFVAPVLAGATQSEGQFSLQLDGTRVPLAETKRADAAGRLSVHSVRVVPGAMAREIVGLAQQIEAITKRRDPAALATRPPVTLLAIRDQQVNFRVLEGRVHHQNMEFQVGDVVLRSQGSVGFDQTVQLTLHVPVQDAWIAKEPLLAGFKGKSLQVPMSGTLTRPQLDQRAIAGLSQQLLQGAAQQAVGGELNKALDKLFKSR